MNLAYFITPPLVIDWSDNEPSSLLDPQFPSEIVLILKDKLTKYFIKKYPKQKKSILGLPEDICILLGEIEFIMCNQIVYLKNVSNDDLANRLPMPHVIEDIFYYLLHEDINSMNDIVEVMVAQSHYYMDMFYQILLETEKASLFIKNCISNAFATFVMNL